MEIFFNGEPKEVNSATVAALLEEFELIGQRIAVEVNKEIVPREELSSFPISPGDRVEVVQFVGGG